jgi:hypothetical protein
MVKFQLDRPQVKKKAKVGFRRAPSFDSRIQRTADSLKLKLAPFANRRIGGDAQGWGQPVDDSIGTLATILARSRLFYA